MWPECVGLKHHPEVAFFRWQVELPGGVHEGHIADPDGTGARCFQSGDAVEGRRLSTTARTEQREEFTLFYGEADVIKHDDVAEML